jgi:hypothetical protein
LEEGRARRDAHGGAAEEVADKVGGDEEVAALDAYRLCRRQLCRLM